jgi:hypothetical protein
MADSTKCPKCPNSPEMQKADFKVFLHAAGDEKHGTASSISLTKASAPLEL